MSPRMHTVLPVPAQQWSKPREHVTQDRSWQCTCLASLPARRPTTTTNHNNVTYHNHLSDDEHRHSHNSTGRPPKPPWPVRSHRCTPLPGNCLSPTHCAPWNHSRAVLTAASHLVDDGGPRYPLLCRGGTVRGVWPPALPGGAARSSCRPAPTVTAPQQGGVHGAGQAQWLVYMQDCALQRHASAHLIPCQRTPDTMQGSLSNTRALLAMCLLYGTACCSCSTHHISQQLLL
jgi:hypothetical protein